MLFDQQLSFNKRAPGNSFLAMPPQMQTSQMAQQNSVSGNAQAGLNRGGFNYGAPGTLPRTKSGVGDDLRRLCSNGSIPFIPPQQYLERRAQGTPVPDAMPNGQGQSNNNQLGGDFMQNFFNSKGQSTAQST